MAKIIRLIKESLKLKILLGATLSVTLVGGGVALYFNTNAKYNSATSSINNMESFYETETIEENAIVKGETDNTIEVNAENSIETDIDKREIDNTIEVNAENSIESEEHIQERSNFESKETEKEDVVGNGSANSNDNKPNTPSNNTSFDVIKQNYDEVVDLTYSTNNRNLNYSSDPFDKKIGDLLTKVTIQSSRDSLIAKSCEQVAEEAVSIATTSNFWVGKYVGNKYKVKAMKVFSVVIKGKAPEESEEAYIKRIKDTSLLSYNASSISYDKVYQYGNLSDRSVSVLKRVVMEFTEI